MRRKEERSKQGQTNKAKQHSTPKAVKKLPRVHVHVLMRDERRKEERSKQGQTNKAKQHSTPKAVKKLPRVHVHVLMRDEEERQARSNKQGKATQHTQGSEKTASGACTCFIER